MKENGFACSVVLFVLLLCEAQVCRGILWENELL